MTRLAANKTPSVRPIYSIKGRNGRADGVFKDNCTVFRDGGRPAADGQAAVGSASAVGSGDYADDFGFGDASDGGC